MADTMQFDLVSPERRIISVAASQVQIPGMGGDLTALPNHAPFLTTLRPGVVTVVTDAETTEYVVTGGFAEISPEATTILAEQAVLRGDAQVEMADELLSAAEATLADAPDEEKMAAAQRVRDINALKAQIER